MKGKGCLIAGGAALVILGMIALYAVGMYNSLVGKQEEVTKSWAQVENVYQRRADLIPNLVQTVKGAANFESETLQKVIEARASATQVKIAAGDAPASADQLRAFQEAQAGLGSALSRLLVTVERYPELKANANFRDLQAQLEGAENRITVERKRFNDATRTFNQAIKQFPGVLYANLFGFEEKPYFEAEEGVEQPPEVEFDFTNEPGE